MLLLFIKGKGSIRDMLNDV